MLISKTYDFYTWFEAWNNVLAKKTNPTSIRKTLARVNPLIAAGPDTIPHQMLRECADQLEDVLTDIFNMSQTVAPVCFKTTTIIPSSGLATPH